MKPYILYRVAWAILVILPLNSLKSQILTVFSAGRQLVEKAEEESKQKRKSKVAERYTVYDTIGNILVPIMRVPSDKIKSEAKNLIISVQTSLDFAKGNLRSGKHIGNVDEIMQNIRFIDNKDPDWVTSYYSSESGFYRSYEADLVAKEKMARLEMQKRERFIADSIQHERRILEINTQAKIKKEQDSLAQIRRLEYLAEEQKKDSIQNAQNRLIETTTPSPHLDNAKTGRQYETHTYYRGPRGGCYYINANGKKVYVDHSYCQ